MRGAGPSVAARKGIKHLIKEYEEFKRFRESRRSFTTAELPEEKFEAIRTSRTDPRHADLDKLLDPK